MGGVIFKRKKCSLWTTTFNNVFFVTGNTVGWSEFWEREKRALWSGHANCAVNGFEFPPIAINYVYFKHTVGTRMEW